MSASLSVLMNFEGTSGASSFVDAAGNLIGTTVSGTVFELVNNGTVADPAYGRTPVMLADNVGSFAIVSLADANGDLFGVAGNTVFEIANSGSASAPAYAATPMTVATLTAGSYADLRADSNGNLFATTVAGGPFGYGAVFEIVNSGSAALPSYDNTPTTVYGFDATSGDGSIAMGWRPNTSVAIDASGNLFGTTAFGGDVGSTPFYVPVPFRGNGMVYELPNTGTVAAPNYDAGPVALANVRSSSNVVVDVNGDVFFAGSDSTGTAVFEVASTAGGYANATALVHLTQADGNDITQLILDADGNLFGTAEFGGDNFNGSLFEIVNHGSATAPNYEASATILTRFNGTNGANPGGDLSIDTKLSIDANGNVFGITGSGGSSGSGTLYAYGNVPATKLLTTESPIGDSATTVGSDGQNYITASNFNGGVTTLSGTAEAGDTVTVVDVTGKSVVGQPVVNSDGTWTVVVSGLEDGSTYDYVATATDAVGNTASSGLFTVTVATRAPTFSVAYVAPHATGTAATLYGTLDRPGTVSIYQGATLLSSETVDGTSYSYDFALGDAPVTVVTSDSAGNIGRAIDVYSPFASEVGSNGVQFVSKDVSGTIVDAGAAQNIVAGTASDTTVLADGFQAVIDTGTAAHTTLHGSQQTLAGGTALNTIVASGGHQYVGAGGSSIGTRVDAGGSASFDAGASATATTVNDAGYLAVIGTATGTTVANGGFEYVAGLDISAVVLSGGTQHVADGGTATRATVEANGFQAVYGGGTASGTTLNGSQQVLAGGAADGTIVGDGGNQYVGAGGAVTGTTVEAGGLQYVGAGATAAATVVNGGSQGVAGMVDGTLVAGGGIEAVVTGGHASDTRLVDGTEHVYAGGSAAGVDFSGAAAGTLVLDAPTLVSGTIANFGAGDTIDFKGTLVESVHVDAANNLVFVAGTDTYSWSLLAQYAGSFSTVSDGAGGTLLTYQPANGESVSLTANPVHV